MALKIKPKQGEIWLYNPDPVKGKEIGKKIRPGLVISCNSYNLGPSDLVTIVPLTSKDKDLPLRVKIEPKDTNLDRISYCVCDQLRTISTVRLTKKIGAIKSRDILLEIQSWILDLIYIE
jgi:mRNA interferase MazF